MFPDYLSRVLYPIYEPRTYLVHLHGSHGSVQGKNKVSRAVKYYGELKGLGSNGFLRTGSKFQGWRKTQPNSGEYHYLDQGKTAYEGYLKSATYGNGKIYGTTQKQQSSYHLASPGDKDLYAVWRQNEVTLTYHIRIGVSKAYTQMNTLRLKVGEKYKAMGHSDVIDQSPNRIINVKQFSLIPTEGLLDFDSWNDRINGKGNDYKAGDKSRVLKNTFLYAQYKNANDIYHQGEYINSQYHNTVVYTGKGYMRLEKISWGDFGNLDDHGCGLISVYNAMLPHYKDVNLMTVKRELENMGAPLFKGPMGTDPLKLDLFLRRYFSKVRQYSKFPAGKSTKGDASIIVFKWKNQLAAHCISGVSKGGPSETYTWYNTYLGIDGQKNPSNKYMKY